MTTIMKHKKVKIIYWPPCTPNRMKIKWRGEYRTKCIYCGSMNECHHDKLTK